MWRNIVKWGGKAINATETLKTKPLVCVGKTKGYFLGKRHELQAQQRVITMSTTWLEATCKASSMVAVRVAQSKKPLRWQRSLFYLATRCGCVFKSYWVRRLWPTFSQNHSPVTPWPEEARTAAGNVTCCLDDYFIEVLIGDAAQVCVHWGHCFCDRNTSPSCQSNPRARSRVDTPFLTEGNRSSRTAEQMWPCMRSWTWLWKL